MDDPSTLTIIEIPSTYGKCDIKLGAVIRPGGRIWFSKDPPKPPSSADGQINWNGDYVNYGASFGGTVTLRAYWQAGDSQSMSFSFYTGTEWLDSGELRGYIFLDGINDYSYSIRNRNAVKFTNGTASVPLSEFDVTLYDYP